MLKKSKEWPPNRLSDNTKLPSILLVTPLRNRLLTKELKSKSFQRAIHYNSRGPHSFNLLVKSMKNF